MLIPWLEKTILGYAREMAGDGHAIYQFESKIEEHLRKASIQEWEADRWLRGIKRSLIKENAYFYRVGPGKSGAFSLFIRNTAGLNVGFRRESITQMATFVSLITDYGYPRSQVRFESRWMDVVVYGDDGEPLVYAENKASEKVLRKLCARLESDFATHVPYVSREEEATQKIDDAIMKANHIVRNRPTYFWSVSPTYRQAYTVNYFDNAFTLSPIENIPSYAERAMPAPMEAF